MALLLSSLLALWLLAHSPQKIHEGFLSLPPFGFDFIFFAGGFLKLQPASL